MLPEPEHTITGVHVWSDRLSFTPDNLLGNIRLAIESSQDVGYVRYINACSAHVYQHDTLHATMKDDIDFTFCSVQTESVNAERKQVISICSQTSANCISICC